MKKEKKKCWTTNKEEKKIKGEKKMKPWNVRSLGISSFKKTSHATHQIKTVGLSAQIINCGYLF
jgi:hypothetical protein